jgi:hypothetical protein
MGVYTANVYSEITVETGTPVKMYTLHTVDIYRDIS